MKEKIFVSVGTHPQPFDRLLRELDGLLESGNLNAEIFAQSGACAYKPEHFRAKPFLSQKEYDRRMKEARIIIAHGGAGTIINALLLKKPVVVVPRLQRYGEHTNDHQLDLAEALAKRKKTLYVKDMKELGEAIKKAHSFRPSSASDREKLEKRLSSFLLALK